MESGVKVGLLPATIEKAFFIQRKHAKILEIKTPYILHGDYSPKHILTDGVRVTGIIDFEDAKGGDPIRDIAWMNFFYGDSAPLDWFLDGYTNKKILGDGFDTKMSLLRLNLGLDLLSYYGSEGNISGLKFAKRKLESELSNY